MRKIPKKKAQLMKKYIEFLKALIENKKIAVGTVLYPSPHKILVPDNKFNKGTARYFLNNLTHAKILTMKKRGEYVITQRFCDLTVNQIMNYLRHIMSTRRRDREMKNSKRLQSVLEKTRTSGKKVNFSDSESGISISGLSSYITNNKQHVFKMLENILASLILEHLQNLANRARHTRLAIEEEVKAGEETLKRFQQLKLSF